MNALGLQRFVLPTLSMLAATLIFSTVIERAVAADPPKLDPELVKKLGRKKEAPAKAEAPAEPAAETTAETEEAPAKEEPPAAPPKVEPPSNAPRPQADPEILKKMQNLRRRPAQPAAPAKEAAPAEAPAKKTPPVRKDASGQTITYTKHIAAILWKNCAACHRPGEIGPFSLLAYGDASKRADFIAEVTSKRRMPPWKPEPNFGKFHDERRLSDREIGLIAGWAEAGAPEGAAADLPKPPEFSDGWQLGEPDLVLEMADSFAVPAEGPDIYRCFVVPIPLDKDTYVRGVEFRPGNPAVVHHAIMFLDSIKEARKKDAEDNEPGYASFGGPEINPTGGMGGWAPGTMPRFLSEGIVTYLKKGSDLVLQVHYHPSGKAEEDKSTVGIYFAKTVKGKPVKIVTGIAVVQPELNIQAGEARAEFSGESQPLPADVEVLGITPHMHNLGREMKVTAIKPNGDTEVPLIWIKDWDFNWQGQYHLKESVRLPKGSVIKVQAVYDNSSTNPKNPNSPPQPVQWGLQSTDEMLLCSVQVVADKQADLKLIAAMPGHELGAGLGGGVPGQAAVARRQSTAKKATPDASVSSALAPAYENQVRTKKADPFGEDGIEIPEDKKKYFSKYDTDSDGKLTRKEVNKMPSGMQAFFVRQLIKKGG
jgi:mono/diheme cytochrome c family protein